MKPPSKREYFSPISFVSTKFHFDMMRTTAYSYKWSILQENIPMEKENISWGTQSTKG